MEEILNILGDSSEQIKEMEDSGFIIIKGKRLTIAYKHISSLTILEVYINLSKDLDIPIFNITKEASLGGLLEENKEYIKKAVNDTLAVVKLASKVTLPIMCIAELNGRLIYIKSGYRIEADKNKGFLDVLKELRSQINYGSESAFVISDVLNYINKELLAYKYKERYNSNLAEFIAKIYGANKEDIITIIHGLENGKSKGIAAFITAS